MSKIVKLSKKQALEYFRYQLPGDQFGILHRGEIIGAYSVTIKRISDYIELSSASDYRDQRPMTYLSDLEVEDAFRRRGLGRAMMQHFIDNLRGPGFLLSDRGTVGYVLYTRLGFKDVAASRLGGPSRVMLYSD